MAIKIYEQFAPFANPADGDYPQGSFKNDSIPGAEDGTPLDAVWANDYAGTDAELFAQAGIVPSGQPDKLGASQRVDAIKHISGVVCKSLQDMIAGNPSALLGDLVTVIDSSTSIFVVQTTGSGDMIDSYALASGLYANRLTSLSGDQFYSYKQRHLLGEALKKLRERTPITFTWYGDSNSVRNASAVQTSFRGTIQGAYGVSSVNLIVSRATSGFSAEDAYTTYTATHSGDISVINFGTNDASTQDGYPLVGNIQKYLMWIERLIIRELNWGKPVVLVTPLPVRFDKAWETYTYDSPSDPFPTVKRIDAYQMGNALKYLGDKYSIPVIDSVELMAYFKDEMFANSTQSINNKTPFGDPVHLMDGYSQAWGSRIAAHFIGDLLMKAPSVFDGDMLNITHGASPVVINSARQPHQVYNYYADSVEAAFAQGDDFVGNRALTIQAGERVTFSFYTAQDNMIIYPTMMTFASSNVLVFLDNRTFQPAIKIDNAVSGTSYGAIEFTEMTTVGESIVNRPFGYPTLPTRVEKNKYVWVPAKGWHTLTILCNSGSVAVSGLNFLTNTSDSFARYKKANPADSSGYVTDYLTGDIQDSPADGRLKYAFPATTGKPSTATGGFFTHHNNSVNDDNTISLIMFYEAAPTTGRVWMKQRISAVWGAWVQV